MEAMIAHPLTAILILIVMAVAGKYLFISKDSEKQIIKDLNSVAKKEDDKISEVEHAFSDSIHKLEISIAKDFGAYGEKIRIVQKEILDEADKKYFTKEMAEKHNERITKMENIINEILPRLAKIDTIFDMMNKQNENHN